MRRIIMKNTIKKIAACIAVAAMCVSLGACGNSASKSTSSGTSVAATGKLADIKKAGTLVVGTSADYPPFEFHKLQDGQDKIMGADIDIAQQIANKIGVKLQIQDMDFDGLLPALESGKIDMVIAGMIDTPERAKSIDFSKVYHYSENAAIVRVGDKNKYKSLADLAGKGIGVQMGTTQEDLMKTKQPKAKLVSLSKVTDLILELKSKKVDAVVLEDTIVKAYATQNKDLAQSSIKFDPVTMGPCVAVRKGNNKSLLALANSVIDEQKKANTIEKGIVKYTKISEQ